MKLLVAVKRVVDHNVSIRVRPDGTGVDVSNVKMSMNPFDEIAVEQAVRLREAGTASEAIAVSIGPAQAQDTLRQALAMGVDRAIHIRAEERIEPLAVAKLLRAVAEEEKPDVILLGKQAIDDDSAQVGPMLAALLGWSQGAFLHSMWIEDGNLKATLEAEGGIEAVLLRLPAVLTADLRLNVPRYASLPNVMKAKKKPLVERDAAAFGLDLAPRHTILRTDAPVMGKSVKRLDLVSELAEAIRASMPAS